MDSSARQSPSGWDGTMKSLLNEALARHQEAEAKEERESEKAKAVEKKKNGDEEEIRDFLRGSHVVFITAGMGGGTGTGSAQYVARVAKEEGALTMGVVTMPFKSEGRIRMENAEAGLDKLRKFSDTTIVIYNDKLLELVVGGPDLTVSEAEKAAEIVGQKINPQARIIWGCSVEDDLQNTVRVLLVITGVKSKSLLGKDVYTGIVKTSAEVDEVR